MTTLDELRTMFAANGGIMFCNENGIRSMLILANDSDNIYKVTPSEAIHGKVPEQHTYTYGFSRLSLSEQFVVWGKHAMPVFTSIYESNVPNQDVIKEFGKELIESSADVFELVRGTHSIYRLRYASHYQALGKAFTMLSQADVLVEAKKFIEDGKKSRGQLC